MTTEETAKARVRANIRLSRYEHLLLEYEWGDRECHLHWVATAPVRDIVRWAQDLTDTENDETLVWQEIEKHTERLARRRMGYRG